MKLRKNKRRQGLESQNQFSNRIRCSIKKLEIKITMTRQTHRVESTNLKKLILGKASVGNGSNYIKFKE